jgi:hypothetical protein
MKKYYCHIDAGHGWLAVKRKELLALGVLHLISRSSYQRGKTVYLEEDCDASIFLDAMEKRGTPVDQKDFKESYQEYSRIRSYDSFMILPEDLPLLKQDMRQTLANSWSKCIKEHKQSLEKCSSDNEDYYYYWINFFQRALNKLKAEYGITPNPQGEQQ